VTSTPAFPDYPFTPRRIEIRPGIGLSYLDEGPRDGEIVVMLHGNPSWSFYWRNLVAGLSDRYRCIVPDHVGMGLSDKPDDGPGASPRYEYTLQSRVDDVATLLDVLSITGPVTLAVQMGTLPDGDSDFSAAAAIDSFTITGLRSQPVGFQSSYVAASLLGTVSLRDLPADGSASGGVAGQGLLKSYTRKTGTQISKKTSGPLSDAQTIETVDSFIARLV
jgi:hypothetical protein